MSDCQTSSRERKIEWTAAELLAYDFPPVPWIVPGLITSGLTVLAGAPKLGKSWLALAICYAVSVGGAVLSKVKVERRRTLLLAREDTGRRLQKRLQQIGATPSDDFHVYLDWPRGIKGVQALDKWMQAHPDTGLIVIDTWGKFRQVKDGDDYSENVEAAAQVKDIADRYDIGIVLLHHTKKNPPGDGDWLDSLLGSTGLAATVDTGMLLRRGRGNREATLNITGRDVEECEYVLHFDSGTGTWGLQGTTAEVQESTARQEIVDLLADGDGPMTPKAIADALQKNHSTTKNLLVKMRDDGIVESLSGRYMLVDRRPRRPVDPRPVYETTESTVYSPRPEASEALGDKERDRLDDAEDTDHGLF